MIQSKSSFFNLINVFFLVPSLGSCSIVYKEEDMEEVEMEIGFPTDVKHVTHIGWDGPTTTTTMMKGWDEFKAPDLVSLPATSLRQFEHAMAAQSDVPHVNDSSVRLT